MDYKEYPLEDAPLIVFLHGGGVSGWMWEEQIKYFSNSYHCIVPDLPGHGLSKAEEFTIKGSAEEILSLIERKRSTEPVIVVGFSLGAQIVVEMLGEHENTIDIAIINSALTRPMKVSAWWLKPLLRVTFPLAKWKSFAKLQAKVLYIGEEQFDLYYNDTKEISFQSFMEVMSENMSYEIPTNFIASTAKILVTVGEKEKKMMRLSAIDLVEKHPHSKGIIIPKIGHGVSLANPNYFNQLVEDWIQSEKLPNDASIIE